MAWMTQNIQRVLEAWHHAGMRRVEGDLLRHRAPVYGQGINVRGVLQVPVAWYRNRLILATPSRARRRANAATGDAHQSPEASDWGFSPTPPKGYMSEIVRSERTRERPGWTQSESSQMPEFAHIDSVWTPTLFSTIRRRSLAVD
jgi:hypothetical protein